MRKTQDSLSRSVGALCGAGVAVEPAIVAENDKLKQAQTAYIAALQGAGVTGDDVVGYVFAINGKINSGDIYASNALFRKTWSKLLAANVTEAISVKRGSRRSAAAGQGRGSFPGRGIERREGRARHQCQRPACNP